MAMSLDCCTVANWSLVWPGQDCYSRLWLVRVLPVMSSYLPVGVDAGGDPHVSAPSLLELARPSGVALVARLQAQVEAEGVNFLQAQAQGVVSS